MSKKRNPLVFLDVSIDGDPSERIVIEVPIWNKSPNFGHAISIFIFFYA